MACSCIIDDTQTILFSCEAKFYDSRTLNDVSLGNKELYRQLTLAYQDETQTCLENCIIRSKYLTGFILNYSCEKAYQEVKKYSGHLLSSARCVSYITKRGLRECQYRTIA